MKSIEIPEPASEFSSPLPCLGGKDDFEELLLYAVIEQARNWTQCVEVLKTTILEMTGNESKYIMLRAVGEDGLEVHFGVKKTSPLGKLKRGYSKSKGVSIVTLRFFFDGYRIGDDDTAEVLGLTENDTIEVYSEQGGTKW